MYSEKLEEFILELGICKGGPISRDLFVLCIERFFPLVNLTSDNDFWSPTKLNRGEQKMAYLTFRNNILLFIEASYEQDGII